MLSCILCKNMTFLNNQTLIVHLSITFLQSCRLWKRQMKLVLVVGYTVVKISLVLTML